MAVRRVDHRDRVDDPAVGLRKSFGEFEAVKGIDVDVRRGEAFGFLGPNGAGKSRTMRMIAAVSPVSGGELRILGMDPAIDGPAIRGRLGVCPQEDTLDNELNVRDNLYIYGRYFGIPKAEVSERVDELLEFVQLTEKAKSKVEDLSGGMKRRLTIARSLINRPDLLLLDEPTTGLDPQARHVLWDQLFRLKQAGRHAGDHDALHGRGRAALRPARGDGQGPDRRRGRPARADRAALHPRGRRAAVRRRRARGAGREGRGPRRPGRGAARPAARLQRRRRGGHRQGPRARAEPVAVLVRRSTLEDVFLRLTGRTLVD